MNKKVEIIKLKDSEPAYTGQIVNSLVKSSFVNFTDDIFVGEKTLKIGDITFYAKNEDKNKLEKFKHISDDALGLLAYALAQITATNKNTVIVTYKEYAAFSNYDVYNTDKKKAKNELDKFRKVFARAFNELDCLEIRWIENKIKFDFEYERAPKLITEKGRGTQRGGFFYFEINPDIVKKLQEENFITMLPKSMFKLGGKNNKDFSRKLLFKLSQHYNINHNKKIGNNDILSIKTLLEWTTLPTVEQLKKINNRHYNELILEPLFEQLDRYIAEGILTDYKICKAKKVPVTDEENERTPALVKINRWYINYTMAEEE